MKPVDLDDKLAEAEARAWDSLARYKFLMFGYWCGVWVHLNNLRRPSRQSNPFTEAVHLAREKIGYNPMVRRMR